jgi:hypothetical protein
VHVFERYLFKQLCAKNSVTAIGTFHLYAFFWHKVIRIALETESNALLFRRGSEVHFRFCRFALSRFSMRAQPTALNLFITHAVDHGALFVGL